MSPSSGCPRTLRFTPLIMMDKDKGRLDVPPDHGHGRGQPCEQEELDTSSHVTNGLLACVLLSSTPPRGDRRCRRLAILFASALAKHRFERETDPALV
jgi:hypothetical protein